MLITFNFRYNTVCGTVRLWVVGILKSASREKWYEIISEVDPKSTLHPLEKKHKIRRMPENVGGNSNILMEIERLQDTPEYLTSDDEESTCRLKSPSVPDHEGEKQNNSFFA